MLNEQGSEGWHKERLGMCTASRFKDVMATLKNGNPSAGFWSYLQEIVAEDLTKCIPDEISSPAIRWGNENEPTARSLYYLETDVRAVNCGFIKYDKLSRVGASPDALVTCPRDGLGGAEIKCPYNSKNHLNYLLEGGVPKEYYWQVQGCMLVTGRKWWDFVSYDPRMPEELQLFVCREWADEEQQEAMHDRLERFVGQIEARLNKLAAITTKRTIK